MIDELFNQLFGNMFNVVGSPALGVLLIMMLIFLGLLYCGLEFDFSLVVLSPIPYAFGSAGYIDTWVVALFIIIPLGIGIYSIWIKFNNRF